MNFTSAAMGMAMETAWQRPAKSKYQLLSPFTMVTWRKYSLMLSMSLEEAAPEKALIVTALLVPRHLWTVTELWK